jgi:gas vesicle protein
MSFKQSLSYVGVLAVGAVTGLAVGVLTAPASGEETRRRLLWRLGEGEGKLRRQGQRAVEEAAARLEHGIESGKQKLDQVLHA